MWSVLKRNKSGISFISSANRFFIPEWYPFTLRFT
jgi:hypothetical protein